MTFTAALNVQPDHKLELTAESGSLDDVRAAVAAHISATDPLVQASSVHLELFSERDGEVRYFVVDDDLDTLGVVTVPTGDHKLDSAVDDVEYGFQIVRNAISEARTLAPYREPELKLETAQAQTIRAYDVWTSRLPQTNHELASVCSRVALWLSDAVGNAETAASHLEARAWSEPETYDAPAAEARNAHEALQGMMERLELTRRTAIEWSRS